MKHNKDKVIGYVRVSTLQQANKGHSIDTQIDKIKTYAKEKEFNLLEVIGDKGKSGSVVQGRDGYKELLRYVETKSINGIICWEISRIGRGAAETLRLLKECSDNKIAIYGISDGLDSTTDSGRLQIKLMSVFAEEEVLKVSSRIKAVVRYRKAKGKVYNGRLAYGMKKRGDNLIKNEKEMKYVRKIKNLRSRGRSWYYIMKLFNEDNIPTKEKGKWQINTLKRAYDYHYGGI